MQLTQLSVLNFKNIQEANLEFSAGINCFFGKNGEGKTNLLDAIYYLSFCKSHSNPIDSQNITHQAEFFMLQAHYLESDRVEEIHCSMKRKHRKVFKRNKKEYERLSDHIGLIPLVLISPADEDLIREGSEERRRFMDMVISQYDHGYMEGLIHYNKALAQRNALLKTDQMTDESLLEMYELLLEKEAFPIYEKRKMFVESFIPVFEKYYQEISGGKEKIQLKYTSHLHHDRLSDLLKLNRQKRSYSWVHQCRHTQRQFRHGTRWFSH